MPPKYDKQPKKEYTIADFIERLKQLPPDLPVKGYIFTTDNGECKDTFEMGEVR